MQLIKKSRTRMLQQSARSIRTHSSVHSYTIQLFKAISGRITNRTVPYTTHPDTAVSHTPLQTSHELHKLQKVTIGRIIMSDIVPLNQGLRRLVIVLLLAVNPVGTNCSDPVHLVACLLRRTARKRKLCLVSDLLHENWNSVIPVARVLDLDDKNGSKSVGWTGVRNNFKDKVGRRALSSHGRDKVAFRSRE